MICDMNWWSKVNYELSAPLQTTGFFFNNQLNNTVELEQCEKFRLQVSHNGSLRKYNYMRLLCK